MNLLQHCAQQIDTRISGKSQVTAGPLFTTQDHASKVYVRNTQSWLADVNTTSISVWNSYGGNRQAGVAISPRHIAIANHYAYGAGTVVRFVDASNNVVERTVSAYQQVPSSDIGICLLDSDLPASIGCAKVVPSTLAQWIATWMMAAQFPVVGMLGGGFDPSVGAGQYTHPNKVATVRELLGWVNTGKPLDSKRAEFYWDNVISGDSGNPVMLLVDGELMLLSHWNMPLGGVGPDYSQFLTAINSTMSLLGSSYQLTIKDLSAYSLGNPFPSTKYASATGNWSTMTWWSTPTGTVTTAPAAGDIVDANAKTVTIDQSINLGSGMIATPNGGQFAITTAVSITANIYAGSSTCVLAQHASGTVSIVGSISGGVSANRIGVQHYGAGAMQVTGNVRGGAASGAYGILNNGGGVLTVTGTVTGGSGTGAYGADTQLASTTTVNGAVFGGTAMNTIGVRQNGTQRVTINGDVHGGTAVGAIGAQINNSGTLTINGNVYGGSADTTGGVQASSGTATITGNVTGGSAVSAFGVDSMGYSPVDITGVLYDGSAAQALAAKNIAMNSIKLPATVNIPSGTTLLVTNAAGAIDIRGTTFKNAGVLALVKTSEVLSFLIDDATKVQNTGVARAVALGVTVSGTSTPAARDVRQGVDRGDGALGTCAVPPADRVAQGEPVDDTVGTMPVQVTMEVAS